jgi:hypothetical protein
MRCFSARRSGNRCLRGRRGENITPLREIERLLESVHGLTSYTDEMVDVVKKASDTFYGWTDLTCHKSEWELAMSYSPPFIA